MFDGDKLLIVNHPVLIQAAERNNKEKNIVPLFYNMSKAKAELLTSQSLYNGLIMAYTGGNIGEISNSITKIWNSGEITNEKLRVIKWLVMINNFTIDYAKTLYKPTIPDKVQKTISKYTKSKPPHFFMYAKGKTDKQVKSLSNSPVDRIYNIYKKKRLNYNFKQDNIGVFDYKVLMNNPNIEFNQEVADVFKKISSNLNFNKCDDKKDYNKFPVYEEARQKMFNFNLSEKDIVDILIVDLFKNRNTSKKTVFWTLFEDTVFENICKNLKDGFIMCKKCHKRFVQKRSNQVYCSKCSGKYQPIETKTIQCCDCGKMVEVDSKDNATTRCDDCYKIYRRKYKAIKEKERRNRLNNKMDSTI